MKKSFIVLQGEGVSKTSIEWNDYGDTMHCATFSVFADDFVARDIAFVVRTLYKSLINDPMAIKIESGSKLGHIRVTGLLVKLESGLIELDI